MPPKPKRRKSFKKEYLPEQKGLLKGRRTSEANEEWLPAKSVSYFHDTRIDRSSISDYFNESSEIQSDECGESTKRTLKCSDCEFTTTLKSSLIRHSAVHKDERPYVCRTCRRQYKTQGNLKKHEIRHFDCKRHQCRYCNGIYRNNSELIRHIRYIHTHERPFKCTECDSAYVERSKLIQHLSSHKDRKLRRCPDCSHTSYDARTLQRHLRTHAHTNLYKCELCGTNHYQMENLRTHLLEMHPDTQTTEYSCNICSLQFPYSTDLQAHMQKFHENLELRENGQKTNDQSITETYECNDCGLAFTQIRNLIGHIMICDRKPGHKKKPPDQQQKISTCNVKQEKKTFSELMTISNYLIRGEVILLPATDADKYIMIKAISNENDTNRQTEQDLCTVKKEVMDDSNVEFIKSKVKAEKFEIKEEIIDEEIEPFFGFDLK